MFNSGSLLETLILILSLWFFLRNKTLGESNINSVYLAQINLSKWFTFAVGRPLADLEVYISSYTRGYQLQEQLVKMFKIIAVCGGKEDINC